MNKCDIITEMQNKIETINQRDTNIKDTVGKKLTAIRKEKGLNQQEVADIIGVSRGALSYWEKGERGIDIDSLYKLCAIYDVSIDYLIGAKSTPETEFNYDIVNDLTSLGFTVEAIECMLGKPYTIQLLNDMLLHPNCQELEYLTHYSRYTVYEKLDCDYRAFLTSKLLHSMMGDIYKEWYVDNDTRLMELSQEEKAKIIDKIEQYLADVEKHKEFDPYSENSFENWEYLDTLTDTLRTFCIKLKKYM